MSRNRINLEGWVSIPPESRTINLPIKNEKEPEESSEACASSSSDTEKAEQEEVAKENPHNGALNIPRPHKNVKSPQERDKKPKEERSQRNFLLPQRFNKMIDILAKHRGVRPGAVMDAICEAYFSDESIKKELTEANKNILKEAIDFGNGVK